MNAGYFHRVARETDTRFWINNPSGEDLDRALAVGAISCTTNPAYCSKLLKSDPDYLREVVDCIIRETHDDDRAADRVYQEVSRRVIHRFLPLYQGSGGKRGFVTLQGDPRLDEEPGAIVAATMNYRRLGPNFMTKIPVTAAGLEAIEAAVEANVAICATEVFALAQAVAVCERYEQAVRRTGNRPPFYVTHISGIFDEYLEKVARREGIPVSGEALAQAGCALARKEYRLLKERGYAATLLGGGARGTHHFTELVGGDVHITINWSTARELIDADAPVVARIDAEPLPEAIDELCARFDVFRQAYVEDGLSVEEFADYGPVQLFRNAFLNGWYLLLAEVASRRHALAL